MDHNTVYVNMNLIVAEDKIEEVRELGKIICDLCKAEPGNQRIQLTQNIQKPNHFIYFGQWESQQHFDDHLKAPSYLEWLPKMIACKIEEPTYRTLKLAF